MSLFKKKPKFSFGEKNTGTLSTSAKASSRSHPTFTDYDQRQLQNHDKRIAELYAQIRLIADHLGFVVMRHDRFGTLALVGKEALKTKEPDSGIESFESEG